VVSAVSHRPTAPVALGRSSRLPGPVRVGEGVGEGPVRMALVRVIHHEVVIRWDIHTDDENADVVPDSTLTDTWHRVAVEHLNLREEAPTLTVRAHSWAEY
jgi:hypothetical protein